MKYDKRFTWLALGILSCLPGWLTLIVLLPQGSLSYLIPHVGQSIQILPDLWSNYNFGSNNTQNLWSTFPLRTFYAILVPVLGTSLTQFVLFTTTIFGGMSGMYLLLRSSAFRLPLMSAFVGAVFFMFNTYVLTYFTSSFLPILVHAALPFQVLFLHLALTKSHIYSLPLAVVFVLVFGINLVFDLIALFLLLTYTAYYLFSTSKPLLARTVTVWSILVALILLLTAWWTVPFFVSTLGDTQTTSNILQSETFYNNDSSPQKVLQLLGNWAFFAGHNNIPYKWYAEYYSNNFFVVTATYMVVALIILGALLLSGSKLRQKKILGLYLLTLFIFTLFVTGGKHPQWPTGWMFSWAFENISYFSALRNTHKWLSLGIFVGSILIAIFASPAIRAVWVKCSDRKLLHLQIGIIAIILLAVFPMSTGLWFGDQGRVQEIPQYWYGMATYIDKLDKNETRIIQTPDQYFDVYDWNSKMTNIPGGLARTLSQSDFVANTCIGCSNPNVTDLLDYIYDNLEQTTTSVLLGKIGISHILQRNDYSYEYYNTQSPELMNDILGMYEASVIHSQGELDLYELSQNIVSPRVFVPTDLIVVDDLDEAAKLTMSFSSDSTAFALVKQLPLNLNSFSSLPGGQYRHTLLKKGLISTLEGLSYETINVPRESMYRVYHSPDRLKQVSVSAQRVGSEVFFEARSITPEVLIDDVIVSESSDIRLESVLQGVDQYDDLALFIGSSSAAYLYGSDDTENRFLTTVIGNDTVSISAVSYTKSNVNLLPNGDFKGGPWGGRAQNCKTQSSEGVAANTFYSKEVDAIAISLKAEIGNACIMSPTIKFFVSTSTYAISLDYRHVAGGPSAVCVWDGTKCLIIENLSLDETEWSHKNIVVKPDNESKQLLLFLYSDSTNYTTAQNEFANIMVQKLSTEEKSNLQLNLPGESSLSGSYVLKEGLRRITSTVEVMGENLLPSGNFETESWWGNASNCRQRIQDDSQKAFIFDRDDGLNKAINLSATTDIACVSGQIWNPLSSDKDYLLTYTYKINSGNGRICVWDGSACIADREMSKTKDNAWKTETVLFKPRRGHEKVSVFIYADSSNGKASDISFDDISIKQLAYPVLGSLYIAPAISVQGVSVDTTYTYLTSSERVGNLTLTEASNFPFVFLETFHPGWTLEINGKKVSKHFVANSFANGWVVDLKESNIPLNTPVDYRLYYTPQTWFYTGLLISGTTFVSLIGYLGYDFVRRRKQKAKGLSVGKKHE